MKNHIKNKKYQRAVSLAELSISIVVIGLLVSAIVAGVNIKKAAEIRGFLTQIAGFVVSIDGFDSKYGDLPGDMADAYTYWSGDGCGTSGSECNGNSDGIIERGPGTTYGTYTLDLTVAVNIEAFRAWQHLTLSEFLDGSYSGVAAGASGSTDIGITVPAAKRSGVGYNIVYDTTRKRNEINIGAFKPSGLNTNSALTPLEALAMDKKNDDGVPGTGVVIGAEGTDAAANSCVSSGAYNLANTTFVCVLAFPAKL